MGGGGRRAGFLDSSEGSLDRMRLASSAEIWFVDWRKEMFSLVWAMI